MVGANRRRLHGNPYRGGFIYCGISGFILEIRMSNLAPSFTMLFICNILSVGFEDLDLFRVVGAFYER